MKVHELYKELGLKPNADPAEVKRAYRTLLKRYHPDLAGANNHTERLDRIIAAYRELMSRREPIPFRARAQSGPRAQAQTRNASYQRAGRRTQDGGHAHEAGRSQKARRAQDTGRAQDAGRAHDAGRAQDAAGAHGTGRSRNEGSYRNRGWGDNTAGGRAAAQDRGAAGARGTAGARGAAGARGTAAGEAEREYDLFTLGRMAVESNSVSRRAFAVRMLGNRRKKIAYGYIRQALNDSAEIVVLEAIRAVSKLEILQSGGELATAFHRGSASVKTAILTAVEAIGRPQYFHSVILSGLRETDPELRRRSLRLFRRYTEADAPDTDAARYRRTASFGEAGGR